MDRLHFASDNNAGVTPEVIDAICAEAARTDAAYGDDEATAAMRDSFAEVFERPVEVHVVPTGTAANALALAAVNPVWGSVLCHEQAHIVRDECGAPTVIGSGLTLVPVPAEHARLSAAAVEQHLSARHDTGIHSVPVTSISITQVTEVGTRYTPDQVAELADVAHARGMALHLDGARFANAVASTGSTPAELTWRCGVDIMSFGATKGGALGAEAVVVFTDRLLDDIERLRKRTGHLLSKQRLAAVQFSAFLAEGAWLGRADHANQQARRLAEGLQGAGVELAHPVEANIVFARLGNESITAARASGARFHQESTPQADDGTGVVRLVASWSTDPGEVDALVSAISASM